MHGSPKGPLRVCFVSARSGYFAAHAVVTDWANGRLVTEIFKTTGSYVFSLAIFSDPVWQKHYDHHIPVAMRYALPFPMTYVRGMQNIVKVYRILKQLERQNDLLIIQLPQISFLPLLFLKKPVIYHLCANVLTASANPFKYKGLYLVIARTFAKSMHWVHQRLFSRSVNRLIVNGSELGELYKKFDPRVAVSSSLFRHEVIDYPDLPRLNGEFRIVFVGRPSKEKGIHRLMAAYTDLINEGRLVSLHMIGLHRHELEAGLGGPVDEGVLNTIHFYGFISWGARFKEIVSAGHVLVMSSISEGTPRVLLEARALGCPVIATRVGGVVTSVTDRVDGVLIEPDVAADIKRSIIDLMENEDFRQQLILHGLETSKKHSLEVFAAVFIQLLKEIENEFHR